MFYVLYDRHFNSLGDPCVLEKWSRVERALDFDTINLVGEQAPFWADPAFVVINNEQGGYLFSGLASTPQIDESTKKTSLSLKDYTTLFNTDIVVDWSALTVPFTLSEYVNHLLSLWIEQTDVGFSNILWDTSEIADISWGEETQPGTGKEVVQLYNLIKDAISLYDLYIVPVLSVPKKTLTFVFKKAMQLAISIKMEDFGLTAVEKSFGDYNRVIVYDSNFNRRYRWALTSDNSVSLISPDVDLVYPTKQKVIVAEGTDASSINKANYEAVAGLANNRYQENIDLDVNKALSVVDLSNVDFSYSMLVYSEGNSYKVLPVGEIEKDSAGKHIIRLGHRVQELTQEM